VIRPTIRQQKKVPLRINDAAVKHFSALSQFHGIPDDALIRLAKRRTRLYVPDRWVAIALILGNRIPIPVAAPEHRKDMHASEVTPSLKLTLIEGGRIGR